jgi:hypothetical protein
VTRRHRLDLIEIYCAVFFGPMQWLDGQHALAQLALAGPVGMWALLGIALPLVPFGWFFSHVS